MGHRLRLLPCVLPVLAPVFLLFLPGAALATQLHPPEEGEYVHQLGHIFFIFSMGILIYWLRKRSLTMVRGWRLIQYSALLLILWNLDAIVVHVIEERDDIFEIIGPGELSRWVHVIGGHDYLGLFYYFGRMDHLLCVPAIVFLYLGLRALLHEPVPGEHGERP